MELPLVEVAATWDTNQIAVNGVTTSAAHVDENGHPDQLLVVAFFEGAASGLISGQTYDIVVNFSRRPGEPGLHCGHAIHRPGNRVMNIRGIYEIMVENRFCSFRLIYTFILTDRFRILKTFR